VALRLLVTAANVLSEIHVVARSEFTNNEAIQKPLFDGSPNLVHYLQEYQDLIEIAFWIDPEINSG